MDLTLNIQNNVANIAITGIDATRAIEIVTMLQENSKRDRFTEKELEYICLTNKGNKLQAVKNCKEHTGMGLKEAKEHVEKLTEKWNTINLPR
jgi:ribosomal protein L7/L12